MISLSLVGRPIDCLTDSCGCCCTYVGTPPGLAVFFPTTGEIADWAKEGDDYVRFQAMPAALRDELRAYYDSVQRGEVYDRSAYDCPCLWYDAEAKRCRAHEWRPDCCREFEVGGEDCLRIRAELLPAVAPA